MRNLERSILALVLTMALVACHPQIEKGIRRSDLKKDVEIVTDKGAIIVRLSDKTPQHRNNFIRLAKSELYKDVLFHRVIKNFLIQAGDPTSKTAKPGQLLGDGDLPYSVPVEIDADLYHRRGALNAARTGDDENPERNSSSTQFTLIQGKVYTDSTLNVAENRINFRQAYNVVLHNPKNKATLQHLQQLIKNNAPEDSTRTIIRQFEEQAHQVQPTMKPYRFPEAHRNIYKTQGGAAHLDQNYTVFGQVVKGMDVVDSIAVTRTDKNDRPLSDIRIIAVKLIKRKYYPTDK